MNENETPAALFPWRVVLNFRRDDKVDKATIRARFLLLFGALPPTGRRGAMFSQLVQARNVGLAELEKVAGAPAPRK